METILLRAGLTVLVLVCFFGIWVGVHLLARRRLGDRRLGCRGPTVDDSGNEVCCNSGDTCEVPGTPKKDTGPRDSYTSS
jgi:hypothetical protein